MKKKVEEIKQNNKSNLSYSGYILLITVGFAMAVGILIKLLGHVSIDSDWFWFIAGVGLGIDGIIGLIKQKRFDRKYKVVDREEFEKMMKGKK